MALGVVVLVLAGVPAANASPGDLDPTFSGDGRLDVETRDIGHQGGVAPIADGYLAFSAWGFAPLRLRRLDDAGQLQTEYGENGTASLDPAFAGFDAIDVQPDGSALIAAFVGERFPRDTYLFRFLADGSLDRSFADDGYRFLGAEPVPGSTSSNALVPDEVRQSSEGKIYVSGRLFDGDRHRGVITRLTPDGGVDKEFGNQGTIERPGFGNLEAIPGGGFVFVYTSSLSDGRKAAAAARFLPRGEPDPGFSEDGLAEFPFGPESTDQITTSAVLSDGRIVISTLGLLIRLLPDGTLDQTFGTQGLLRYGGIGHSPGIATDGSIYLAGRTRQCLRPHTCDRDATLTRLSPSGKIDPAFGDDGTAVLDFGPQDFANGVRVDLKDRPLLFSGHETASWKLTSGSRPTVG